MRLKFLLAGVPVFVLLLSAGSARACSCAGSDSPCEEFGTAAAVFVGTVTGVRDAPPPTTDEEKKIAEEEWEPRGFKFAVTQSYFGAAGAEVEVWTGRGGGDCGYRFERGATYLVYAYRMEKSGRLATGICTRTTLVSDADAGEDLEFLRGLAGRPHGVTISGTVVRQRRNLEEQVEGGGMMSGATVVVEGAGERREVRTDAQGRFSVSALKAGTYKVKLLLPEGLSTRQPERELTVADRGCASTSYQVIDNGRVSGVVTDAEGKPAARVRLTLTDAEDPELERGYGITEITDEEGRYGFTELPPGRYLLAVNLARFPEYGDAAHTFPRTYYPAAASAADAEVITLGEGEELRGRDLRLPPRRDARTAEITVIREDGRPAAGALVKVKDVTYHDRGHFYRESADAEGRFRLKGYEGQTLVVEAETGGASQGDGAGRSGPLTVRLSERQAPLRLVVKKNR